MSNPLNSVQGKAISSTLLTLIMLNLVFWGAIKPTIFQAVELHQRQKEYQKIYSQLHQKNETLNSLIEQYSTLKKDLTILNYYYPHDGDFSLLIDNLYKIAHNYDFKLQNITFSEKITKQVKKSVAAEYFQLNPTTFTCQITGPINNLKDFLAQWEQTPFAPQIVSLSYNLTPNKMNQTISVVFIVYKLNYNLAE